MTPPPGRDDCSHCCRTLPSCANRGLRDPVKWIERSANALDRELFDRNPRANGAGFLGVYAHGPVLIVRLEESIGPRDARARIVAVKVSCNPRTPYSSKARQYEIGLSRCALHALRAGSHDGARAGSDRFDHRHRHRFEQRRAAGRHGHADRRAAHRRHGRPGHRRRTAPTASIACRRAPTTSSSSCRASRPSTARRHPRSARRSSRRSTRKLEVGSVSETITVTGESPTVDTKSNVQQTVMNQEILEGVPTGRDPWSLAKLIPGVQVATYDVGGTQSMQQSSMSAHGSSTNDVSYNIDGATVNWPGGGGGATMLYYDQGMFEEVNYMTSAIPGRSDGRRRLDQHGHQGRRQQVEGQRALLRSPTTACRRSTISTRRPRPRAIGAPDVPRQPDQEDLRLQLRRRRRARPEPPVGERHDPQVGRQQAGQRQERRRQPGARRQRPEELLGQGRSARSPPTRS